MLTRQQVLKAADFHSVPAHIIEQDYLHSLFLSRLYSTPAALSLVFKGGTCLRLVHKLDRFSEDLDFSLYQASEELRAQFPGLFRAAASSLSFLGIDAVIAKERSASGSFSCRLRYAGPLFDGSDLSRGSVSIDVSLRDDVFLKPAWAPVAPEYPDVPGVRVLCMQEAEIFSEKLRAAISRAKPRDFYDIWFLLGRDIECDIGMVKRKCAVTGVAFRQPKMPGASEWQQVMGALLGVSVPFDQVKKELDSFFDRIFPKA